MALETVKTLRDNMAKSNFTKAELTELEKAMARVVELMEIKFKVTCFNIDNDKTRFRNGLSKDGLTKDQHRKRLFMRIKDADNKIDWAKNILSEIELTRLLDITE